MCCPLSLNTVHALWSILSERIPFGSGCCCWLVLSQLFLMCSGCWEVIFSLLECGIFQGTQMSPAPSCHPRLCVVWAGWVPSLMKCVWLKCWGPFNKHNTLTLSHWKVLAGRCSSGTKLFIGSSASRLLLSAGWAQDVGALLVLTEGENSSVPVSYFVHLLIREKQQCQERALVFWCSMVVLFCWWSSCVCFFSKLFLILWLQMEKPRRCLKKWKKKKKEIFPSIQHCSVLWLVTAREICWYEKCSGCTRANCVYAWCSSLTPHFEWKTRSNSPSKHSLQNPMLPTDRVYSHICSNSSHRYFPSREYTIWPILWITWLGSALSQQNREYNDKADNY